MTACTTTTGGADAGGDNTLTVVNPYPIVSLDPHGPQGADLGTQQAGRSIYSRLIKLVDGEPQPDLAESWTASEDVRVWTFKLREAKFSDGTDVTSADVAASIRRTVELDGPLASNYEDITVETPSDHEVVLTSEEGDSGLPGKLNGLFITPAERSQEDGFFNAPVGSGPFEVESFKANQELVVVPNEQHWAPAPKLTELTYRVIPEVSTRLAALSNGEIDATWGIPDDQVQRLRDEGLVVETVPSTAVYTMWFNSSRPTLADAAVRRALWQAVDYRTIVESLYPETGEVADAPLAPSVFGHAPQEPVTYDPAAARSALQAAGFDFGTTLEVQFSGAEFRQFADAVAADLAEIGVQVEPVEKEKAVWLEDFLALDWDINIQSLSTATLDADINLGRLYLCEAKRNGYCNPELDRLLNAAGTTGDRARREELYAEASKIIWEDAVGMFPMFVNIVYAWREGVEGLKPDPSYIPELSSVTNTAT